MRIPEAGVEALLDGWPVARLATVAPDGRPHQVPIVFARVGGTLWSPIDAKPKRGGELARVRHLEARPDASLLLDAYHDDWSLLWWLRVEARARIVRAGEAESSEVAAAVAALREKYPAYAEVAVLRDPPTLIAFTPRRWRSWCAGPEAVPGS